MAVKRDVFQTGVRELHAHDVGDAVLGPFDNARLEGREQFRPRNGRRTGAKSFDKLLRKIRHDGPDLHALQIGRSLNDSLCVREIAPSAGVSDRHQSNGSAGVFKRQLSEKRYERTLKHFFRHSVVAKQVRQVENLNIRENARRAARRRNVNIHCAVGNSLQALRAVRAKLRSGEYLH